MSLTFKASIAEDNLLPGAQEKEEQLDSLDRTQQNNWSPLVAEYARKWTREQLSPGHFLGWSVRIPSKTLLLAQRHTK